MNNSRLYIENIGLGLGSVSNLQNLNLNLNEYVVVGKRENNQYNLIVNMNGIGINASRQELLNTNAGLLINNDIICKGTISASNIKFNNFSLGGDITTQKLETLIKTVNSNLLFFNGCNLNNINNIYTPNYLTIGDYNSTYLNSHPLKISDNPNGTIGNIQFAIYNKTNNTTEEARLAIGMMGYNEFSPTHITTTEGMPLQIHVSKPSSFMNGIYENGTGLPEYNNNTYPNLSIDTNGCVNINKDRYNENSTINPNFYVNGNAVISNLFVYDYISNCNLHLNDIYLRKTGLTLNANQIIGGDFAKQEFTFTSNVNIGRFNSNLKLDVYGTINSTSLLNANKLIANNTTINGIANFNETTFFNNTTIFNENITIDKSLNINNDLFINGYRINTCNLNYASNGLNYDNGSNLNISGRLGVGIFNTDTYDHQFNIIKRNKERFEIYLQDYAGITIDSSKVFMGHTVMNDSSDNSFIIFTQKNIRWHNIYFYAGKDRNGTRGIRNLIPNLAIMENNCIGINNKLPQKALDVNGEIIANDYFIKTNNKNYKLNFIVINENNNSILNVNNFDINLNPNVNYLNKKTLNLTGGINSYDGYFENNSRISTFKISNNLATSFDNIGIGIAITNNTYSIPLQIRNSTSTINNNSIIRLYRGIKGGGFNNNSLFTGIDFCDYDMPLRTQNRNNYKWFIYKNNENNRDITGTLQIGYTDNTYNPTHSAMNFYFNQSTKKYFIDINNPYVDYNYNKNNAVSIKGNVEIEGNVNLKGTNVSYMINGAVIGSFTDPNVITNISTIANSYATTNLNDMSLIGNKLLFIPNKTTVIAYNDNWIFDKINTFETFNNNSPLFIYNNKDYNDDFVPPVITRFYNKSFKNYTTRPDIATIELGIISDDSENGTINNKINFSLKGYNNNLTIFELNPNNNYPYITCLTKNNKNQVNFGNGLFYSSSIINNENTTVNISDDLECLLKLTNNNKPSKLSFVNDIYNWNFSAYSNLDLSYNNNPILTLTSNNSIVFNTKNNNYTSSFNINSIANKPSIELINYYNNDYNNPTNSLITNEWIYVNFDKINIETIDIHKDYYDDNFDINTSKFIYKIYDSNLPTNVYKNYRINNSNFIFNDNRIIPITTTINNIEIDYRFLNDINVYTSSNTIEILPVLNSRNPNLKASVKTFSIETVVYNLEDLELNLNYRIPETFIENQLYLEGITNNINFYSNFSSNNYYNLSLTTYLKIKDKPLFDYSIKTVNANFLITANNSNYYYNTTNTIFYYPLPNFTVKNLDISINYLYNFENSFVIPKNFFNNYTNITNISSIDSNVIINNSNSFLKEYYLEGATILDRIDVFNFRQSKLLSTDIINKIYTLEINDVNITDIIINFTKNNYYEVYDFNNNPSVIIPIPIINNNYQPHIILKNNINSSLSSSHKIYSYDNKLEFFNDNLKLLTINSNGDLNTNGSLTANNFIFTGDIYNKVDNEIVSITSNLTHIIGSNFYIHKNNISLNSSNIFLNPSTINKGGIIVNGSDLNDTNNLFQINNHLENDNFMVFKSVSPNGYINFFNTTSIFKLGVNNGNFGIWRAIDSSVITNSYISNNLNYYSNVINFAYDINNQLSIDINGNINTTKDFSINSLTSYYNNPTYKIRIYGNLKVDGVVITSSDKRIKRDITKIDNALEKIEKLTGVFYYNNNDITNHRQMGLIAQEVKEIVPEVVYEDDKGFLNIAYGNLMGIMIEAIKELRTEIKNNK